MLMTPHYIRLVGPWKVQWLQPADPNAAFSREESATMPRGWGTLFGPRAGRARFRRSFHAPTNLDADEHVAIEFTGVRGLGTVRLNDALLGDIDGSTTTARFDVTAAMGSSQDFHLVVELQFDPTASTEPGGLFDIVRLVIESGAAEADRERPRLRFRDAMG